MTLITTEVVWVRNLLGEIGFPQSGPSKIFCDNRSAIHMANNDVIGPKSKHISIKFHYVKEAISNGDVTLEYVPSSDNVADFMTKPLDGQKFSSFRSQLNLQRSSSF